MANTSEALLSSPLLRHLEPADLERVLAAGHEKKLSRGAHLFNEGEKTEALFVLLQGRVKMVRYTPQGREMLLHMVNPGQTFAEAALFGRATYPASAVAVEDSQVWCWPRERLLALVRSSPELALALILSVSLWTRTLVSKLELLTQRRVEERLAIYLLGRSGGRQPAAGDEIPLREPRNLIAAQIGTGPEVLSRTFRRLEEDGILESSPKSVRVLSPERLQALADWLEE